MLKIRLIINLLNKFLISCFLFFAVIADLFNQATNSRRVAVFSSTCLQLDRQALRPSRFEHAPGLRHAKADVLAEGVDRVHQAARMQLWQPGAHRIDIVVGPAGELGGQGMRAEKGGAHFKRQFRAYGSTVDAFCPGCERVATFRFVKTTEAIDAERKAQLAAAVTIGPGDRPMSHPQLTDSWFEVRVQCTRGNHGISFFFKETPGVDSEDSSIEKIGQTFSLAALTYPETERFASILGKEKYQEYRRGIGLASHGANIGAFTYLRRVFNFLLETAHAQEVKENAKWDDAAYQAGRNSDRVKLLSHRLPKSIGENAVIYAILSAGMHELSEDVCGQYFETLKAAIDLMLNESLAAASRAAAEVKLRKSISAIATEVNKSNP